MTARAFKAARLALLVAFLAIPGATGFGVESASAAQPGLLVNVAALHCGFGSDHCNGDGLGVAATARTQLRNALLGHYGILVRSAESIASNRRFLAAEGGSSLSEAFSYGSSRYASTIEANGLRAGSSATPAGDLSPLQAQLELALPPTRDLPSLVTRIDIAGLREAGYEIPQVTRVGNMVRGAGGRVYSMPGGGWEMQFPYSIPPEFVNIVR